MIYKIDYKERMSGYYPPIIRNIREFKTIVECEYPEFERLRECRQEIIDDAYLLKMGEERIKQWEKALSIRPIENSSLQDRRETIIARMRGQAKLNTETISSIVNAFTEGSAKSYIEDSVLHVVITPPPGNKKYQFANVEQELSRKVPAHLGLVIEYNYETWDNYDNEATWNDMLPDQDGETWEDILLHVDATR